MSQSMKTKHLLWIILALTFGINMMPASVYAPPPPLPTMSVEPPSIIDETMMVGDSFSVDLVITDVLNLGGYEFKLGYDTSVLTATGITYVDDPNFFWGHMVWTELISDFDGYVWAVVTLPIGATEGVDGSGTVVTIDFTIDAVGETSLDLFNTALVEILTAIPIDHEPVDGYFSNIPIPGAFNVDFVKRSAWPQYHHFSITKHGAFQTLHALVRNLGTYPTTFYVVFEVWDATDTLIETLATPIDSIAVDETRSVVMMWTATHGKFKVYAQCWYKDGQGNWIAGAKVKRFGFAIVNGAMSL